MPGRTYYPRNERGLLQGRTTTMSEFLLDDNESLSINWVYDDLNDAHCHDLMHIVYDSLQFINDGDCE